MQYATDRLVPISLFGPSAYVAAGVAGSSIVRLDSISNEYFIYPDGRVLLQATLWTEDKRVPFGNMSVVYVPTPEELGPVFMPAFLELFRTHLSAWEEAHAGTGTGLDFFDSEVPAFIGWKPRSE